MNKNMKAQYLSFDAIIASIIFIIIIISAISYLKFSVFSEQAKSDAVNSQLLSLSNMMLTTADPQCTLLDISSYNDRKVKAMTDLNQVDSVVTDCLAKSTPYVSLLKVECQLETPLIKKEKQSESGDIKWIAHSRRGILFEIKTGTEYNYYPCSVDLYLGKRG